MATLDIEQDSTDVCDCNTKCKTKRCKCVFNGKKCVPGCHPHNNICTNTQEVNNVEQNKLNNVQCACNTKCLTSRCQCVSNGRSKCTNLCHPNNIKLTSIKINIQTINLINNN